MVDSRNFKKQNQKGQGLKKHKWIPLVVIVVLALVLILIQYFMIGKYHFEQSPYHQIL